MDFDLDQFWSAGFYYIIKTWYKYLFLRLVRTFKLRWLLDCPEKPHLYSARILGIPFSGTPFRYPIFVDSPSTLFSPSRVQYGLSPLRSGSSTPSLRPFSRGVCNGPVDQPTLSMSILKTEWDMCVYLGCVLSFFGLSVFFYVFLSDCRYPIPLLRVVVWFFGCFGRFYLYKVDPLNF